MGFFKKFLSIFIPRFLKKSFIISAVFEVLNRKDQKFDVEYFSGDYILGIPLTKDYRLGAICLKFKNLPSVLLRSSTLIFITEDTLVLKNWGLMSDEYLRWTKILRKEDILFLSTDNIDIEVPRSAGIKVNLGRGKSFMFYPENNGRIDLDKINNAIVAFKEQNK
ncbi:MAG: hypothetical protein KAS01_02555 [Candidatus Pacebacteria bacterium]|nr:hypothetical protein [Candidatus Paceibacterota bacterium]